jgi:hypothetical protein
MYNILQLPGGGAAKGWLMLLAGLFLPMLVMAQEPVIKLGKNTIALNEPFTITVTVSNEDLKNYQGFPDIPGFAKAGTNSSTSTSFVNGNISFTQSITQNYIAQKEGTYTLKPFTMKINGSNVRAPGSNITVGAPKEARRQQHDPYNYDPFEDWFGSAAPSDKEYVDVKEDAFFAVTTSHDQVYVGEGFTATVALFVAEDNQAEMNFYELGAQLGEIIKKIRPANCWEENYGIDEIHAKMVTVNNKKYKQYKIFQATYFPLNTQTVKFPSIGLKMVKYKIAKEPSFFGNNRVEDFKTFYSEPKEVNVKELPPHPLKDVVAVGNYKLAETVSKKEVNTGESFNYTFRINGEGNISAINAPQMPSSARCDFYPPTVRQSINRVNNRVSGSKTFNYYAVPTVPGQVKMGDYFSWVYFNPTLHKYDTLRAKLTVNATGERQLSATGSTSNDNFYRLIDQVDNKPISRHHDIDLRTIANIFMGLLLVVTVFIMVKK